MELLLLYFWLKINSIIHTLIGISVLSTVGMGILALMTIFTKADNLPESEDYIWAAKVQKKLNKWVYLPIICTFLSVMLPNKTDIAILVGASVAIDVAKSPEGTKVGQLLRAKANELLDDAIKDLKKEEKKEEK